MYCKHCGNQLEPDAQFCQKCGAIAGSEPTPGQGSPSPSAPSAHSAQLIGTGQILKTAWANYKGKFWKLIAYQFLVIVPFGIIIAIGLLLNKFQSSGLAVFIPLGLLILVVVIFAIFWAIWMQASTIQALIDEPSATIKQSMDAVKPKLRSYFWGSVVAGIITMLGFVLLVIPGIIFAVWFVFSSIIIIVEGKKGIESVRLSKEYVKGYWWAVLGRFILVGLVMMAFYIVVAIVMAIIGAIIPIDAASAVIQNILSLIVGPFLSACLLAIYLSLKSIKGPLAVPAEGGKKYAVIAVIAVIFIPLMIVASIVLLALNSARGKARDAQRVADVNQINSAVLLYSVDNNRLPPSLDVLVPKYLDSVPQAPTPADGAKCTEANNKYTYKLFDFDLYYVSYCLGSGTSGKSAGYHYMSEDGYENPQPTLED